MNTPRRKGTSWETLCVEWLRDHGVLHAERRALNGNKDRGDLAGIPGCVGEFKAQDRIDLPGWLTELNAEMVNDNAAVGFVWAKKKGKGSPADGYIITTPAVLMRLLREAGYLPSTPAGTVDDPPEWAVDHPGLGIYAYPSEDAARTAAGTAGTLLHHGLKMPS